MKEELFDKIEDMLGELESLERLVGVTLTQFFEFRAESLTQNELKENYTNGQIMLNGLFDLLHYRVEETKKFIERY